jgi:hypothetical protein
LVRARGVEPPLPAGKQFGKLPRLPFRHARAERDYKEDGQCSNVDCRNAAKLAQICDNPRGGQAPKRWPRSNASGESPAANEPKGYNRPMPRKPKPDNPEQYERFLEAARQVGIDPEAGTFDRVLEEVARSSRPKPEPKTRRPRKQKPG